MKKCVCFLLTLSAILWADTLTCKTGKYSGIFTGYSKFRIFFQEWDGVKPEAYDPVRTERIKFDKPAQIQLTLTKDSKKTISATLTNYSVNKFTFIIDGNKKEIHYRQVARIEARIDTKDFMKRREQALNPDSAKNQVVDIKELLEPGKACIVHFHVESGVSSARQGNLAERLCNDSRGKATYHKITVNGPEDSVAKKYKLTSLPQFLFFNTKGALVSKLADRFTEEDIEAAFNRAKSGK